MLCLWLTSCCAVCPAVTGGCPFQKQHPGYAAGNAISCAHPSTREHLNPINTTALNQSSILLRAVQAAFTRGLTFEEFVAVITSSPTKGPGTAQAAAAGTASLLGEPSSSSVPGQQPGGRSSAAGSSNSNGSTGGGSLQAAPRKSAGRVGRGSAAGASGAVA